MAGERGIMFGRQAAERIKKTVIRVEGMPYPTKETKSKWPIIAQGGGNVGVVGVNGVTARVGTNAGMGTVWIWSTNATTGALTNTNASVTAFSISSTNGGLNSGTWVEFSWRGSVLYVDAVDCGN